MARPKSTYTKPSQEVLKFPNNLGPIGIVFTFVEYSYSSSTVRSATDVSIPEGESSTSIILPLPTTLEDKYGINVGADKMGAFGGLVADAAMNKGNIGNTVWNEFKKSHERAEELGASDNKWSDLANMGGDALRMARYFGGSGLDSLAPGINNAIDLTQGTVINPHKALTFQGTEMKEFNFTWVLTPESEEESTTIKTIRDRIRKYSLPKTSGIADFGNIQSLSRAFLKYPNLVLTELVGVDKEHYITFKPAMVKNIALNYSSQGNVILKGGKPAHIQLSMSIAETRPHTRNDYEEEG